MRYYMSPDCSTSNDHANQKYRKKNHRRKLQSGTDVKNYTFKRFPRKR